MIVFVIIFYTSRLTVGRSPLFQMVKQKPSWWLFQSDWVLTPLNLPLLFLKLLVTKAKWVAQRWTDEKSSHHQHPDACEVMRIMRFLKLSLLQLTQGTCWLDLEKVSRHSQRSKWRWREGQCSVFAQNKYSYWCCLIRVLISAGGAVEMEALQWYALLPQSCTFSPSGSLFIWQRETCTQQVDKKEQGKSTLVVVVTALVMLVAYF